MFTITAVKATKPPTYTREDTQGEPIQGTFYEEVSSSVQEIYSSGKCSKGEKTECLLS